MLAPMVRSQTDFRRLNLASHPVASALLISVLLHILLVTVLEIGFRTGLWNVRLLFPKRQVQVDARFAQLLAAAQQRQQQQEQEMPLEFVDVDPSQAAPEPPKDAKYYSALNSRAANPDTRLDTPVPKIEGKQQRVPQTLDRARSHAEPLQPAPPPPPKVTETKPEPKPPPPEPKPEVKAEPKPEPKIEPKPEPEPGPKPEPQPTRTSGEMALAKLLDRPKMESQPAPQTEPSPKRLRRLADARQAKGIVGEKMKQEGGVRRFSLGSTLDVRATPFGSYDAAIIAAVQKRWYDLLDNRDFASTYSGKVVLEFRLNSDGRVTDMKVNESDVTDLLALLCERAVQDPAPFAPWPSDLRRLVGKDYREVRFTFYYN